MFRIKLLSGIAILFCLLFVLPASAQSLATTTETIIASTTSAAAPTLDDISPETITSVPSSLGLLWRTLVENMSLAFTFDPIKRVDKIIKFSQERLNLAKYISANSQGNADLQNLSLKMIERANFLDLKLETNRREIAERNDEDTQKALKNIANHSLLRLGNLDEIQKNIQPENNDKFQGLSTSGSNENDRLLKAINSENISTSTREHLQEVQVQIEEHASTTKAAAEIKQNTTAPTVVSPSLTKPSIKINGGGEDDGNADGKKNSRESEDYEE